MELAQTPDSTVFGSKPVLMSHWKAREWLRCGQVTRVLSWVNFGGVALYSKIIRCWSQTDLSLIQKEHSKPASSFPVLPLKLENLSRSDIPSAAFAHNAFLSSSHEVQLTVTSFSCHDHDSKSPSLACSRTTVGRQSSWAPTVGRPSVDCRWEYIARLSADYRPTVDRQGPKVHMIQISYLHLDP